MAEIIEAEIKSNVGEFAQDAEKAAKQQEILVKALRLQKVEYNL